MGGGEYSGAVLLLFRLRGQCKVSKKIGGGAGVGKRLAYN